MFSKDCIWSRSRFVEQGVYFQSAGFPICVTTVLGCSPCISLCPAVPTPLSGLNTYLGKYWAANHMPCSLSAPKTPITHRLFFLLPSQSRGGGTELLFFFFFVSAGPNQSLFIQVNHALMHECSLSDSPCEPHSGHSHPQSCHWMGAVESDQLCSRSSHSFAYIWLSTALRQLTLETNKTQTFPKKSSNATAHGKPFQRGRTGV